MSRKSLTINDVSKASPVLTKVDNEDLMPLPWDIKEKEPKEIADGLKEDYACILDDVCVLNIPRPKTKEEEQELVDKFLSGMKKSFSRTDNWTFLTMLETTMENCAKCNTCSDACHLYEASGENEMYRPNYRTEIFRRIYKKYIKKEPFSDLRNGKVDLNWRTIARLGEMSYRCNICRRCAQACPIGVDNALVAREIRKIFSQEMGIAPPELHEGGSVNQMRTGSSTQMTAMVAKDNVEFIDEDFGEETGYEFHTPWDVEGADILLIHNAGEIMAWPDNIAAFSIIFEAAGLSWTLSSEVAGYDSINYGVFYDDVQYARTAILHAQSARRHRAKKIFIHNYKFLWFRTMCMVVR